jgi:aspartate/glutamate racemase
VRARRGGLHSTNLALRSTNFAPLAACNRRATGRGRATPGVGRLGAGGSWAEYILICTNIMHLLVDEV